MPAAAAPSVLRGWRLQAADGRCWLPAPRAVGRSAAVRGRFPPVVNALLCSERLSWATTGRNPADVLSGLQARSSSWRADPPLVSKQFAVTLKENQLPRATAVSHHLLLRAGFLRQSAAGVFAFLPLAVRSLNKIEALIDQEMERLGSHKVILPNLSDAEPWKTTGRWETAGSELFRVKDRRESDFCLAPTHEEEITKLVARDLDSWRQLPVRLYQIGRKFRDEISPTMGLLRAKEFIMADLYSFDATEKEAKCTYDEVVQAFRRLLKLIGVPYKMAEADSGKIGGPLSHEFHVCSDVGEDVVIFCNGCGYTASHDRAVGILKPGKLHGSWTPSPLMSAFNYFAMERPEMVPKSIRDLLQKNIPLEVHFSLLSPLANEDVTPQLGIVITGANRRVNRIKLRKAQMDVGLGTCQSELKLLDLDSADITTGIAKLEETASAWVAPDVTYFIDASAHVSNEGLPHGQPEAPSLTAASRLRELVMKFATPSQKAVPVLGAVEPLDVRAAAAGDACPHCETALDESQAIEVGHTFLLRDVYSKPLKAVYYPRPSSPSFSSTPPDTSASTKKHKAAAGAAAADAEAQAPEKRVLQMGCYGLGVTRLLAAIAETSRDSFGLIWPPSVAPYRVCVLPIPRVAPIKESKNASAEHGHRQEQQPEANGEPTVLAAHRIFRELSEIPYLRGEIILDDRYRHAEVHPGWRMRDADLIGYPWLVVIGRGLAANGTVEIQTRANREKKNVKFEDVKAWFEAAVRAWEESTGSIEQPLRGKQVCGSEGSGSASTEERSLYDGESTDARRTAQTCC